MTASEIKAIVNENNKNEDIKWRVTKNTAKHITLINDYLDGVTFNISAHSEDGEEWITVKNADNETMGIYIKGSDRWSDYEADEEGFKMGVRRAVKAFYYYY